MINLWIHWFEMTQYPLDDRLRQESAPHAGEARPELFEARERENDAFKVLLGGPANIEALIAFAERREPDFSQIDDSPRPR